MSFRGGFVLELKTFAWCSFCYKEFALSSFDLEDEGLIPPLSIGAPDDKILVAELKKRLKRDGWKKIKRNRCHVFMCGQCRKMEENIVTALSEALKR